MIKALIIDDEELSRRLLKQLLIKFFPHDVEVVGMADSAESAREFLVENQPDVLFLDIEMPGEDGFDFLRSVEHRDFAVVFVTAYDQYALRAFKASAADYILKPVDFDDLQVAVKKVMSLQPGKRAQTENYQSRISAVLENIKAPEQKLRKLAVPSRDKVLLVDVTNIVYFKADDNYAKMYQTNGEELTVSKSLKECEDLFSDSDFIRIHKSYLINLHHVKAYVRADTGGGSVELTNSTSVEVSRRLRATFLKRMHDFAIETK
ncbi:MAG: LytTR family DNA-binding domain-containing protein [Bacteroidota bacterium]